MVELLKQDQYVPMPFEEQVILIFAGTQGFLDEMPLESIRAFEEQFLNFIRTKKQDVAKEVREKKALDDDLKAKISAAITEFMKIFQV
jgi:F-type H+-transporting ATPase subunit alpha